LVGRDNHRFAEHMASAELAGFRSQRALGHGEPLLREGFDPRSGALSVFEDEAVHSLLPWMLCARANASTRNTAANHGWSHSTSTPPTPAQNMAGIFATRTLRPVPTP
jgi:hypothetical protein